MASCLGQVKEHRSVTDCLIISKQFSTYFLLEMKNHPPAQSPPTKQQATTIPAVHPPEHREGGLTEIRQSIRRTCFCFYTILIIKTESDQTTLPTVFIFLFHLAGEYLSEWLMYHVA